MISYFWLLLLKCNTSKGEWAVPTWWPSSFQGMNIFASLNLGLSPPHRINQNIWRYCGVPFKKIACSFRLLLFWEMNLDNMKLEAGVMATCEISVTVPGKILLSSVFSLSLPFSLHSPFSTCFFPCNLSLNFENVKHKKSYPHPLSHFHQKSVTWN